MHRVVVIGGGITGLATAHRLLELHSQIELNLVEAGPRLGGIIHSKHRDGFLLELGPDSFISEKPEATNLAKRIGLESNLIETNHLHRRSFVVRAGRLHPVPEGFQLLAPGRLLPFVKSDIFSWSGKLRMAMDLVLPRRKELNGNSDETLADFVRRRLGLEALERMAQPMVGGIYTADPEFLSLRSTLPRLLELERENRSLILALRKRARKCSEETRGTSGARYSLFLSFDGGMQILSNKLASLIPNDSVKLNTRVKSLSLDQAGLQWTINLDNGESLKADAVCLCIPSYMAASLLNDVDASIARELKSIPYASTATVNFAYRRQDIRHALNGFGFVVPYVEGRSLIACTFSSVKFPGRAPEDHVLLRAFVGGALQPEMFALEENEMVHRIRSDFRDLLGIEEPPLFTEIARWRESMPQYHIGHLERVKRIEQRLATLRGLHLAGNAYSGAGIPDCIRMGEATAERMGDEG